LKQQNSDVVDFELDQLAKFPEERVNTDDKKKVLRCLFKQMRELNLQNEVYYSMGAPFETPFAKQ